MNRIIKRGMLSAVFLAVLSGCAPSVEDEALAAVSAKMFDPDAAKFRDVRQVGNGSFCGEVNGKNRYGAYVGFTKFYASRLGKEWSVFFDSEDLDMATRLCKL